MPFRKFTDARGVDWTVWEVRPERADRRKGEERRKLDIDDPGVDPPVINERISAERRGSQPSRGAPRVRIGEGLAGGWLAFESASERRRLSPIPSGWESAPESELAGLCARASVAPGPHGHLVE